MVNPWGYVNSRWDPLLEDQGAYKSQKSQALWGNKGHTSRTSRKPFGGPKGLQVAKSKAIWGPRSLHVAGFLGDQRAYKSQKSPKSQALLGKKVLTSRKSRKPFGGNKVLTSRKSRNPFGGPRGLQVALSLGDQRAYKSQKSQALWGNKGLTSRKSRKPFGGPRGLQVHFLWGTKGLTSRKSRKPFGGPKGLQAAKSKAL